MAFAASSSAAETAHPRFVSVTSNALLPYLAHCRMSFHWLLAPLFLWGAMLSQQPFSTDVALGFVALHLFLYPGATAFNGSYDRDVGPVSALADPPEVPKGFLAFSLALQIAGLALALPTSAAFTAIYVLLALVFTGYSHPATRWKASPLASTVAVGLGQGALGVAAGWAAATGEIAGPDWPLLLGGSLVGTLATLGLYPSTQIFQADEDAARGDRTLVVALGPAGALWLAAFLLSLAAIGAALVLIDRGLFPEALAATATFGLLIARHISLARTAEARERDELFRWATATRWYAAFGFLALLTLCMLRQAHFLTR